jgi:membrane protease YdiL (CAAX protease family)
MSSLSVPVVARPRPLVRVRGLRLPVLATGQSRRAIVVVAALATVVALASGWPAGTRAAQPNWLVTWLLMAPVCEELFFRGVLHEALLRAAARWAGNVAVALAFGALHAWSRDAWTGVAVVLPALCIGRLYERERRVVAAAALHASFNLAWLAWGQPGAPEWAGLCDLVSRSSESWVSLRELFA